MLARQLSPASARCNRHRGAQHAAPAAMLAKSGRAGTVLARSNGVNAPAVPAGAALAQAAPADQAAAGAPAAAAAGMRLRIGACCLPHPDKSHYGGEDAFFVSPAGGGAFGVADGVGGWAESGICPAQYSRTLMRVTCAYIEGAEGEALARAAADGACVASADSSLSSIDGLGSYDGGDAGYAYAFGSGGAVVAAAALGGGAGSRGRFVDPVAALDAAHRRTRCAGSATAVVLQLDGAKRRLVAANLGDSGFLVARGGAIVARSKPLQHFFDCPLQLGAYPEFVDDTDTAAQAEVYEVPLQHGDIIVAGSDGLWDNAYEAEILGRLPRSAEGAQAAAESIAAMAREHASDPDFASPYTREALQQGYDLNWLDKLKGIQFKDGKLELATLKGGKQDDITVIVSYVEDSAAAAGAA